jgi:alkylation response protein AidB-like acyl-CoA dehydrogenase
MHGLAPRRVAAGIVIVVAKIFTILEGTSEIQRMIIGRAVTGLDVR